MDPADEHDREGSKAELVRRGPQRYDTHSIIQKAVVKSLWIYPRPFCRPACDPCASRVKGGALDGSKCSFTTGFVAPTLANALCRALMKVVRS